jgi:hypothetical protein
VAAVALALMGPAECQQDRPQEEPDGEPDRGGAQVLRGVVRQYPDRRAGRIFTDDAVYHNRPQAPVTEGAVFGNVSHLGLRRC